MRISPAIVAVGLLMIGGASAGAQTAAAPRGYVGVKGGLNVEQAEDDLHGVTGGGGAFVGFTFAAPWAIEAEFWLPGAIRTNPEDGVKAMIAERPDARLNPAILHSQIKLTLDYFDTPASKGKPIGWQAKEDWEAALKSMEAAGVVNAGWNAADYYTNALVE